MVGVLFLLHPVADTRSFPPSKCWVGFRQNPGTSWRLPCFPFLCLLWRDSALPSPSLFSIRLYYFCVLQFFSSSLTPRALAAQRGCFRQKVSLLARIFLRGSPFLFSFVSLEGQDYLRFPCACGLTRRSPENVIFPLDPWGPFFSSFRANRMKGLPLTLQLVIDEAPFPCAFVFDDFIDDGTTFFLHYAPLLGCPISSRRLLR